MVEKLIYDRFRDGEENGEGGAGKDVSRGKSAGRRGEVRKIKRRDVEDVRMEEIRRGKKEKAGNKRLRRKSLEKRRRVTGGGEGKSVQGPLLVKQVQSLSG